MNRTAIEDLLKDFKPFQQIKQTAGLEELTLLYLDSSTGGSDEKKQDVDEIKQIMKGNGLDAVAVYFHEMYECLQLLQKFSKEQIVSGIAHREGHREAHDDAQLEMFRLYQHLGQKVLGIKIPIKAFALAAPYQIMESTNRIFIYEHKSFGRYQWLVDLEPVTKTDIAGAMNLFETLGFGYGAHKNGFMTMIKVVTGLDLR